eukprot:gene17007-18720_t
MASGKSGYLFTNWAKTFACQPELYFEPTTVGEIGKILQNATANKKKVKVVGFGHSPSDISCTNDYMICLTKFNNLLQIDNKKNTVKVEGGMMLRDLNEILEKNGLAMQNLPAIDDLTIAGLVATGTHGSGVNYGILATLVLELEMMTADGNVIICSNESNPEIFKAALLSLGALGIILNITLQCEPAFVLHQVVESESLDQTLKDLEQDLKKSEHFKIMYHPHTDRCVKYHIKRSKLPINDPGESWFWDILIGFHVFQFFLYLGSFLPPLIVVVNKVFHWLFNRNVQEKCNTGPKVLHFNCLFPQYVSEWCFPRDKTAYVLRSLRDLTKKSNLYVHLPVEIRFGKADDILLSPCYKQDSTFMNILMYRPYYKDVPGKEKYWSIYEQIVKSVGGRPHWAKAHRVSPDEFRTLYPKFDAFLEIRKQLDPNGVFLNEYLQRHLLGTTSIQI